MPKRGEQPSPVDGLVSSGALTMPRATVSAGGFVFSGVAPGQYTLIARTGSGQRGLVNAPPGPPTEWGVIDLVYPQIEEGRVVADATVEGLGEYFVGDRLRVWISGGTRPAYVIPAGLVKTRFGIDYVLLRQGDGTVEVPVQRGRQTPTPELPNGLEILSGIRAGDQLERP